MKSNRIKFIIFLLITAFIFLGPAYRHVLGGQERIFRKWVMWSGQGIGILDLRLYGLTDNNEKEFINFKKLLLQNNISEAEYRNLRIIRSKRELSTVVYIVCNKSKYSGIQMKLRKATSNGWITIYDREDNICIR